MLVCIFVTVTQVPTLDFLNEKLGQYMAMYNDTVRGAHLDLVFFKDAMTHLVKVKWFLSLYSKAKIVNVLSRKVLKTGNN